MAARKLVICAALRGRLFHRRQGRPRRFSRREGSRRHGGLNVIRLFRLDENWRLMLVPIGIRCVGRRGGVHVIQCFGGSRTPPKVRAFRRGGSWESGPVGRKI